MPLPRYTPECLSAAQGEWPASGAWVRESAGPAATTARAEISAIRPTRRPESIRLFENRFVENVLAKAHPITPVVWFGPLIAYGLFLGLRSVGAVATLELFVFGWLLWTLLEYVMHRFLFHMCAEGAAGRQRSFMVHGYHHEFPNDRMRLVAPPLMSWPLATVVVSVNAALLGRDLGLAVFAGTAAGYVAYDWIHYYAHHFRPANPVGRFLRRYHLQHHYDGESPNRRFGVSSPLWDLVFGTYEPSRCRRRAPAVVPPRAARARPAKEAERSTTGFPPAAP